MLKQIVATSIFGLSVLGVSAAPALADASNQQIWESSTGTRSNVTNSWIKGNTHSVTTTNTLKLDGLKGDIYVRDDLTGNAWFADGNPADNKDIGFGAALTETQVDRTNVTFGSDSRSTEDSEFKQEVDTFSIF